MPQRGESNQFAKWHATTGAVCRIAGILSKSQTNAKAEDFMPINQNTPHSLIRQMMEAKNCILCGEPLKWEFGPGKTPHLHHDHVTGEIYGFAHAKCNPRAEAKEMFRLRAEVKKLHQEVQFLKAA